MTTTQTSNDAKKLGGYLKEKFTIGLSRITSDEVVRAILKVSSHKLKAPNEKHLTRLISASHGHYNSGGTEYADVNKYIVEELARRSHAHNWIVVLKTMISFHRLMRDGSLEINTIIQADRDLFCLRHLKDVADSPDGAAQQGFIEQYIRYLEERSCCQQRLGLAVRIESDEFIEALGAMDLGTLTLVFDAVLSQFECACDIEFRDLACDNFATMEAYKLVIFDAKRLYVILSGRIMFVLETFEALELPLKKEWLKMYKRYAEHLTKLAEFFESIRSSSRVFDIDIPKLRPLPDSLLRKLEDEVRYCSIPKVQLSPEQKKAKEQASPVLSHVPRGSGGNLCELFEPKQDARGAPQQQQQQQQQQQPAVQHAPPVQRGISELFDPIPVVRAAKEAAPLPPQLTRETSPPAAAAVSEPAKTDLFRSWKAGDVQRKSTSPPPSEPANLFVANQPPTVSARSPNQSQGYSAFPTGTVSSRQHQPLPSTQPLPPPPSLPVAQAPASSEFDPFAEVPAPPAPQARTNQQTVTDFFATPAHPQPTRTSPNARTAPVFLPDGSRRAW